MLSNTQPIEVNAAIAENLKERVQANIGEIKSSKDSGGSDWGRWMVKTGMFFIKNAPDDIGIDIRQAYNAFNVGDEKKTEAGPITEVFKNKERHRRFLKSKILSKAKPKGDNTTITRQDNMTNFLIGNFNQGGFGSMLEKFVVSDDFAAQKPAAAAQGVHNVHSDDNNRRVSICYDEANDKLVIEEEYLFQSEDDKKAISSEMKVVVKYAIPLNEDGTAKKDSVEVVVTVSDVKGSYFAKKYDTRAKEQKQNDTPVAKVAISPQQKPPKLTEEGKWEAVNQITITMNTLAQNNSNGFKLALGMIKIHTMLSAIRDSRSKPVEIDLAWNKIKSLLLELEIESPSVGDFKLTLKNAGQSIEDQLLRAVNTKGECTELKGIMDNLSICDQHLGLLRRGTKGYTSQEEYIRQQFATDCNIYAATRSNKTLNFTQANKKNIAVTELEEGCKDLVNTPNASVVSESPERQY